MIKTWDEILLEGYVDVVSTTQISVTATLAGDLVFAEGIVSLSALPYDGTLEGTNWSCPTTLEQISFYDTAPKNTFIYSNANVTVESEGLDNFGVDIYLGKNVSDIAGVTYNSGWKSFTVHPQNAFLEYKNNGLYSKDFKTLFAATGNGDFTVNENAQIIKAFAFGTIKNVVIPTGIVEIEENASSPYGDSYLKSISLPLHALEQVNLKYVDSITITSGTEIEDRTFENYYVKEIILPDSIISIGEEAFQSCTSLTSVTIGNSVTTIGNRAFYNCYSLASVTIPDSVTTIGDNAFYNCYSLTSVAIGNSVTSIGEHSFTFCSLTSVVIPDSVTSIGYGAFAYCPLESVTLGVNVKTLEDCVFEGCFHLQSIIIPISVTNMGTAFEECEDITIYCEAESKPDGWNNYWNNGCSVIWGYTGN